MIKQSMIIWAAFASFGVASARVSAESQIHSELSGKGVANPAVLAELGVMTGFYRFRPVLCRWMTTDRVIRQMPEWMQETDFPYQKRPYGREVAFADGLTCVRLLGGLKIAPRIDGPDHLKDLVYRDEMGELHYRWNLLKERLDPYVNLGYDDLTLVMDNVPWCFPSAAVQAEYGQIAPPEDYAEWQDFIRKLCQELKRLYGERTVRNFRFRMGTEMQDRRRFLGSFEEYLRYYDHAAAAVKAEIPEAGFGPFNRSMPSHPSNPSSNAENVENVENVDIVMLARHCLTGSNRVTGETGSPFDFFARSFYYFSYEPQPGQFMNTHPDQRVPEIRQLWDEVEALDLRFTGLSREVHEFSPHLRTEGGIYGPDTGSRGAAQAFHTIIALKEAGVDRLWHWNLFEDIERDDDRSLLFGLGWLYAVFDHMRGGQLYTLSITADGDTTNSHKAAISIRNDRAILVVANWNMDRTKHEPNKLAIVIPNDILPAVTSTAQMLSFTETTSVYDVLRSDLKAADLLSEKQCLHRGAPTTVAFSSRDFSMAADEREGTAMVLKNWSKYEGLMRDSLTLRRFSGSVRSDDRAIKVCLVAECPSVSVIVLDLKQSDHN